MAKFMAEFICIIKDQKMRLTSDNQNAEDFHKQKF